MRIIVAEVISHDPSLKEKLVRYNLEDCLALKAVFEFIQLAMARRSHPETQEPVGPKVVNTTDLGKRRSRFAVYGRPTFVLKDLERASDCAYFDYQRERVFARTDKKLARINRRMRRRSTKLKPNKYSEIGCENCVLCGSSNIRAGRKVYRRLIDLKFSKDGVKRWVTKYSSRQYQCAACGKSFLPEGWPTYRGHYGENLAIWCVYQNIACRQTMWQVADTVSEMFSINVPVQHAYKFKKRVISQYSALYDDLRMHIMRSPMLCIDEGDVTIRNTKGYVWVFATTDAVWYLYKDTRSGDFLKDLMTGFSGVLVSDFYSAYDSIDCPQQKCLLHLLRDINEDLQKNPFDDEFKLMAQDFGTVLRGIVDTIDRYGLTKRHLHKHKRAVEVFLAGVSTREFTSEAALIYQKRFKKYGLKMFTLLDHDGVPWNNNGAEHAVKYFMKYRRTSDGLFTERSLKEALVMLSILQTCKLNGINLLKFLLSKKTDIGTILGL